jgi:hypothetical protein
VNALETVNALEIDGVTIINATPHDIWFLNNNDDPVIVEKCGKTLAANPVEQSAGERHGAALVKTVFEPSPQGEKELTELEAAHPNALIVGSIISAQAYPGRVVGLVPVPGMERAAPQDKRFLPNKFITF